MMKGETVLSGAAHPGTEMKVLYSANGYFLGFTSEAGYTPYTRETHYFKDRGSAQLVLDTFRSL